MTVESLRDRYAHLHRACAAAASGRYSSDPQRFVFVRDGFNFWAFVLAPLLAAGRRLWLVLLGYVRRRALIGIVLLGASGGLQSLGCLLIALLVGFEAANCGAGHSTRPRLAHARLSSSATMRKTPSGVSSRVGRAATPRAARAAPNYATPVRRGPPSGSDVIGCSRSREAEG